MNPDVEAKTEPNHKEKTGYGLIKKTNPDPKQIAIRFIEYSMLSVRKIEI